MHIVHIVFSFDVGGLENGIVNIVNRLPESSFTNSIICLTDSNPEFCRRITNTSTSFYSLHKKPGKDPAYLFRLWKLLRSLKPDIVHTRNLTTIECQLIAFLAGTRIRVHGEHGWDSRDAIRDKKAARIRKLFKPLITRYISLSEEAADYLSTMAGISAHRIEKICNGVDTSRFTPEIIADSDISAGATIIGTVGRLAEVKNQRLLIRAFHRLRQRLPDSGSSTRLLIVGEGPARASLQLLIDELELNESCFLYGNRDDIPRVMASFDIYVQPSLAEGISNTILEAMSSGLPVISTAVGGAPELIRADIDGKLIDNDDLEQLVAALEYYVSQPEKIASHGRNGRQRAESSFSLTSMTSRYQQLYENLLSPGS